MTKHVYYGLDGARGIAALAVVIFHKASWTGIPSLAGNAYLAVDLFFMLSGFVVARAYSDRIVQGMSFAEFSVLRLIRLLPMHAVGIVVGTAALFVGIAAGKVSPDHWTIAKAAMSGLLFLPFPIEIAASPRIPPIFPVNGPVWSLFFELLANAVLFFAIPFATRSRVLAVVLLSAFGLVLTSLSYGSLHLGWSTDNFLGAVPRTVFGFAVGLLFFVYPHPIRGQSFWKVSAALAFIAVALFVPHPGKRLLDPWIVFALMGAGWVLIAWQPTAGGLTKANAFLGALSYPIYILHMPVFFLVRYCTLIITGSEPGLASWFTALTVVIALSAVLLKVFDEPIRERLARRLKRSRMISTGVTHAR